MNWQSLKQQLERIFQTKLQHRTVSASDWTTDEMIREIGDELQVRCMATNGKIHFWSLEKARVSDSERALMELTLQAHLQLGGNTAHAFPEDSDEAAAVRLSHWIERQLDQFGDHPYPEHAPYQQMPSELTSTFFSGAALQTKQIPIIVAGDYADSRSGTFTELKKLLESFFQTAIVLIPLKTKEWLVLVSEDVLMDSDDAAADEQDLETPRDALETLCHGLYDMLTNEWIGACHLSIDEPIQPEKMIVQTVRKLREVIALGNMFHVEQNLHFPWRLTLEGLVHALPDQAVWLSRIFEREGAAVIDQETLLTLETFFEQNCNVSETAKTLYIHRNTLLYRLEKFKQETGLDPRNFNQAVLVKIAGLLYKVTKRK